MMVYAAGSEKSQSVNVVIPQPDRMDRDDPMEILGVCFVPLENKPIIWRR